MLPVNLLDLILHVVLQLVFGRGINAEKTSLKRALSRRHHACIETFQSLRRLLTV